MPVWGLPCAPCVETAFAVRIHLSHPYPIPPPSHPLLCRGREIGGRVLTVSIRCTAESSTSRRTSIVDWGSRPEAALRGVGRFIVAGRLPIPGKTVGRTGGAIFGFISHYKKGGWSYFSCYFWSSRHLSHCARKKIDAKTAKIILAPRMVEA